MNAAARLAIGLALLAPAFMAPLTAQEAALPALAFQTSDEAKAFDQRLARLDTPGQTNNQLKPEILVYRIRSRGVEGTMLDSLSLTNLNGRQILRASRTIKIAGKHQEEVSDLEPGSLLPIRHIRRIHEPFETIREDTALWDHAGLRFFCEGNRIRDGRLLRQLYRKEWRLGKDLPANAVDGLTAFIQFRAQVLAGLTTMYMPIVESSDGRFECVFSHVVGLDKPKQPLIGHEPVIVVSQRLRPESGAPETAVEIDLTGSNAIPQRFEGEFFGMPAMLELVRSNAE